MSTYTSGLLDFNFSQEEIDITKGRRYPCSISASVSGVNLETCKCTFFGILDKVLVAVEEPINGLLRILYFFIGFEGMVGGFFDFFLSTNIKSSSFKSLGT
jgi:hypothetical protein